MTLRICSYNIHKGFSQFNRRMVVHELRDRLQQQGHTVTSDQQTVKDLVGTDLKAQLRLLRSVLSEADTR